VPDASLLARAFETRFTLNRVIVGWTTAIAAIHFAEHLAVPRSAPSRNSDNCYAKVADLTFQERAEHIAEWVRLTGEKLAGAICATQPDATGRRKSP
jgi:hypothetical protein